MTASYLELQKQIKDLEAIAETARKQELAQIIETIRKQIQIYKITPQELGFKVEERKKPIALYRDESGKSWSGKGRRPNWIKKRIEEGTLDLCLVEK